MFSMIFFFRKIPIIKKVTPLLFRYLLKVDIPITVIIGSDITFSHNSFGLVIHPLTTIKNNVKIYPQVTIGRSDIYLPFEFSDFEHIVIEEGAILCTGAKILCKKGKLVVGKNSIIGANAVLFESTGTNEIWAGNPAKKVGIRTDIILNR